MSGASSSGDNWLTLLDPVQPPADLPVRADDPRLGQVTMFRQTGPVNLQPGQPVLIGFPVDEGVRRNHGRTGAAQAPFAIRRWLYRLATFDCGAGVSLEGNQLLDLGNVRAIGDLEETQDALAEVVATVLAHGAVPIVLGGGHETAYGHFLGYVRAARPVGIINIDAHLDVRPGADGRGTSGTPFRQALAHRSQSLPGEYYVCIGAQPQHASRDHFTFLQERGGRVHWCNGSDFRAANFLEKECKRLAAARRDIYLTLDADSVRAADVPGVSAPNPMGLAAEDVATCMRFAGAMPSVRSMDLVEINPRFDRDDQSARWAAAGIWNFLVGLAARQ